METYRIAIIGLGGMGNNHALAVQDEDDCKLLGGAEIDSERWRRYEGIVYFFHLRNESQ